MTTSKVYPHDRVRKLFAFNHAMSEACSYFDRGDTYGSQQFIVYFNRTVTTNEISDFDILYDNYTDPEVYLIDYQLVNRVMFTDTVNSQTMTVVHTLALFRQPDDIFADSAKLWLEVNADSNVTDPTVSVQMYDAMTDEAISTLAQADATEKFSVVQLNGLRNAYPTTTDAAWYLKASTSHADVTVRVYHLQWRYVSDEIPQPLPGDA